jgi:4-hydroxy-tetrahydrodipicolinate synthase
VIKIVVERAASRVPVIVGCTAESTFATIERVKTATGLGADAVMVASPRAATTPKLQIGHFESVCDAIDLPVVLQDEPVTTGVTMSSETIGAISEHDRLVAIKVEESPSPTKIGGILGCAPAARCFGGLGGLYAMEELGRGAVGVMTGFAIPQVLANVCRLYDAGDVSGARKEFYEYLPLIRYEAQLGVGGVAIRKQLFVERGIIAHATVRGPSPVPDARTLGELHSLLEQIQN